MYYVNRQVSSSKQPAVQLNKALTQISEIREQIARSETFRGYRAIPTAFSGVIALVAGAFQSVWIERPTEQLELYLGLWIGVAVVSCAAAGIGMAVHLRDSGSTLGRQTTLLAIEQFLPCIVAGLLITGVFYGGARESCWMLPGLWSVLFSLGVFASHRLVTRGIFFIGLFYLVAGVLLLMQAQGQNAFAPWAMMIPFGGGQLACAIVLWWALERKNG